MKKILYLVCLAALLILPGSAFAEGITLDVGGLFATEPADELGSEFGFTVGGSYDLSEAVGAPLEARVDVSYIKWSEEESATIGPITTKAELEFRRLPIFLGARYNFPVEPVTIFGELGLEVSLDKMEATLTMTGFPPITADESETNIGATPGVGVVYPVTDSVLIGANARYHIVSDSYITVGLFVGFKL